LVGWHDDGKTEALLLDALANTSFMMVVKVNSLQRFDLW
jgi:hypothetical protein